MFSKNRRKEDILDDFEGLNVSRLKDLLTQDTFDAHQKAFNLLQEKGLTSFQCGERVHTDPDSIDLFSKASIDRVNDFAHMVLVYLNADSRLLELGCGYGNDALLIAAETGARVTAVDASSTVISEAKERATSKGIGIDFQCEDYMKVLKQIEKGTFNMVYCHSAAHYFPSKVFESTLLPLVARVLSPGGAFCLVMKTAHSFSAQNPDKIALNDLKAPYLYTLDKKDHFFSMYPQNKQVIFMALKKHFDIIYEEEVGIEGYDEHGKMEVFACMIARPRVTQGLKMRLL